jgi:4-hydroxy-2-oxoheptanedioate aldolase
LIFEKFLVIIHIEIKEAVDNLEALAGLPGVDVFFIGPEDLSISLGLAGQQSHPQMKELISRIISTATERQIFPGIHSSDPTALSAWSEQGIRFIAYASDIEFLYNGALQGVQALRGSAG